MKKNMNFLILFIQQEIMNHDTKNPRFCSCESCQDYRDTCWCDSFGRDNDEVMVFPCGQAFCPHTNCGDFELSCGKHQDCEECLCIVCENSDYNNDTIRCDECKRAVCIECIYEPKHTGTCSAYEQCMKCNEFDSNIEKYGEMYVCANCDDFVKCCRCEKDISVHDCIKYNLDTYVCNKCENTHIKSAVI